MQLYSEYGSKAFMDSISVNQLPRYSFFGQITRGWCHSPYKLTLLPIPQCLAAFSQPGRDQWPGRKGSELKRGRMQIVGATFFGFLASLSIIIIQSFVLFTMVIVRLIILRIHHANLQKGNFEGKRNFHSSCYLWYLCYQWFTIW